MCQVCDKSDSQSVYYKWFAIGSGGDSWEKMSCLSASSRRNSLWPSVKHTHNKVLSLASRFYVLKAALQLT